jgi:hypothetical protein
MAATQLGADLLLEPGATVTGYVVVSRRVPDPVTSEEEKVGADGALANLITYYSHPVVELVLEPLAATAEATILTDFPKNAKCTVSGLTAYTVRSRDIERSAGPARVTVRLVLDGLS